MNSITLKKVKDLVYFLIGIILILLIFQILHWIKNNSIVLPSFIEVMSSIFGLLSKGETYVYIGYTLLNLIIAIAFGVLFGILLGVFGAKFEAARKIMKPIMSLLRMLPVIVLIIILMVTTSFRFAPAITGILIITPIVYEGVKEGILNINRDYIDAYLMVSRFNFLVLIKVYIPLIASYIKQAFVTSLGMGIKVVITAEYVAGVTATLGYSVYSAVQLMEFTDIYAYTLIMIFLVIIVEYIPFMIWGIIKYQLFEKTNEIKLEI